MLKRPTTAKIVCVALLSVFLAACASKTPQPTAKIDTSLVSVEHSANVYLNQAKLTQVAEERDRYLLLAAHAYINDGNVAAAKSILTSMRATMVTVDTINAEHLYLSTRIIDKTESPAAALQQFNYPSQWRLPKWQMATYHQYKAKLYQQNQQPIDQVRQLSLLSQYLPKSEAVLVNDDIWHRLQPLHEETLKAFMNDTSNPIFSGWLQLTYIAKHYAVAPSQLVKYLGEWQQQNPSHPGAIKLPTDLENALSARPFNPQHVAVMLPLSGKRARVAEPIRQGILASYLAEHNQGVEVRFYDTENGIANAYQQAQENGSDFIIGPLFNQDVEQALNITQELEITTPQLFLNQPDEASQNPNQFFYSLSPTQEASDAALKMVNDGIKKPLIFASNDSIGKRMADSFIQEWQEQTQEQVEVHYFDSGDKMKVTVQAALGVKDSQERISRMKQILGSKLEADFRSRQDIDAIYMISGAKDLILLKPFLDVNFSVFSRPIALYTSSRGRVTTRGSQNVPELNGTLLSDIPWLMQSSNETRMVSELWGSWNNSKKRLYVMGYDAFELINRLAQMRAFPGYQHNGRSGILTVTPEGVLERQLSWGKYRNGQLKPL
ncbi:penicillin-binding protein activator [Shewanella maritima]|uniref:Penicillin-binding protein activator n=1 Tax=Shewanella maritima TaxID=2520507 RepID=A0A411PJ63_9GAMM|nr:penicillin-binding protein activator [Shewanella maritima]QBF83462.1 penicillin-binding protein activator [Shewanella maritima]